MRISHFRGGPELAGAFSVALVLVVIASNALAQGGPKPRLTLTVGGTISNPTLRLSVDNDASFASGSFQDFEALEFSSTPGFPFDFQSPSVFFFSTAIGRWDVAYDAVQQELIGFRVVRTNGVPFAIDPTQSLVSDKRASSDDPRGLRVLDGLPSDVFLRIGTGSTSAVSLRVRYEVRPDPPLLELRVSGTVSRPALVFKSIFGTLNSGEEGRLVLAAEGHDTTIDVAVEGRDGPLDPWTVQGPDLGSGPTRISVSNGDGSSFFVAPNFNILRSSETVVRGSIEDLARYDGSTVRMALLSGSGTDSVDVRFTYAPTPDPPVVVLRLSGTRTLPRIRLESEDRSWAPDESGSLLFGSASSDAETFIFKDDTGTSDVWLLDVMPDPLRVTRLEFLAGDDEAFELGPGSPLETSQADVQGDITRLFALDDVASSLIIGEGIEARFVDLQFRYEARRAVSVEEGAPSDRSHLAAPVAVPNPFNPRTEIRFTIDRSGPVRVSIFDTRGRRVATLHDGSLERGEHRLVWSGEDAQSEVVASGVYLVRLEHGDAVHHARLTLVR